MSRWEDGISDADVDMQRCIDCGQVVESRFSTEGPRVCVSCAVEEADRKPTCMRCRQVIEKGPLCEACETAIETHREAVLRKNADRWPAILRGVRERIPHVARRIEPEE